MEFNQNDIVWLVKRGWITQNEEAYSVHPMVRNSVRLQTNMEGKRMNDSFYNTIVKGINNDDAFIAEYLDYTESQEKILFMSSVGEKLWEHNIENVDIVQYYSLLGKVLRRQGNYRNSIAFYEKALHVSKSIWGESSVEFGVILNDMSYSYYLLGDYSEGAEICKSAINTLQQATYMNSPLIASAYNSLAMFDAALGNYYEAMDIYDTAIYLLSISGIKDDLLMSSIENNRAYLISVLGDYDEALIYCRKDLEETKNKYGENHRDTATSYNNLALCLNKIGKYSEAEECCKKAIDIDERVLGTDHPSTAIAYDNMGQIYDSMGQHERSLEYSIKAIRILEKSEDGNPFDISKVYNSMGLTYSHIGNVEDSLKCYKKALQIREDILGENHPATGLIENNIGVLYTEQADYESAIKHYARAYDIWHLTMDDLNPDFVKLRIKMAEALYYLTRFDESRLIFQEIINDMIKCFGEEHPEIISFKEYISTNYPKINTV